MCESDTQAANERPKNRTIAHTLLSKRRTLWPILHQWPSPLIIRDRVYPTLDYLLKADLHLPPSIAIWCQQSTVALDVAAPFARGRSKSVGYVTDLSQIARQGPQRRMRWQGWGGGYGNGAVVGWRRWRLDLAPPQTHYTYTFLPWGLVCWYSIQSTSGTSGTHWARGFPRWWSACCWARGWRPRMPYGAREDRSGGWQCSQMTMAVAVVMTGSSTATMVRGGQWGASFNCAHVLHCRGGGYQDGEAHRDKLWILCGVVGRTRRCQTITRYAGDMTSWFRPPSPSIGDALKNFPTQKKRRVLVPRTQETPNQITRASRATSHFYPGD